MNTEQIRADFEVFARPRNYDLDGVMLLSKPPKFSHYVNQATQDAFEAYQAGRAVLQSQDRDGARLDWLQQHDERFYNLLRITSIVNKGFSPTNSSGKRWFSSIREAIDHARRAEGDGE